MTTTISLPDMAALDTVVREVMERWAVPRLALAALKDDGAIP